MRFPHLILSRTRWVISATSEGSEAPNDPGNRGISGIRRRARSSVTMFVAGTVA